MSKNLSILHICSTLATLLLLLPPWQAARADAPRTAPVGPDSAGFAAPGVWLDRDRGTPYQVPQRAPDQKKIGEPGVLFTFAIIGDSHIRSNGGIDLRYIKDMDDAPGLLANYVRDINAHVPPVDFTVHLGDITDLGMPAEFDIAKQVLDSLACPLWPVLGNHDDFQSDHKQAWLNFAGLPSPTYSFDVQGYHFIVIDCTLDPYLPPRVNCDAALRAWVAADLASHPGEPTVVFSHYNMWLRPWNPMFDTTQVYAEYLGMPELRQILESSGCVVAVINGHVHANRVEVHNGIYYIDVGATMVGPPSIRYFDAYPDRIEASFAYISDQNLFARVTALCPQCYSCFSPSEVCGFIDGRQGDKRFSIPVMPCGSSGVVPPDEVAEERPALYVSRAADGHVRAKVSSGLTGTVEISLSDVRGRSLGRCVLWKAGPDTETDLTNTIPAIDHLAAGIYFVRAMIRGKAATAKLVLLP
jgi:3',5'-cyclic-AMP phosphodiesterase